MLFCSARSYEGKLGMTNNKGGTLDKLFSFDLLKMLDCCFYWELLLIIIIIIVA